MEDSLHSGVWVDPLFPGTSSPVPGTWVQHTAYSTVSIPAFGLVAQTVLSRGY